MSDSDLLEKAIGIAVQAHRGQRDRYKRPYILHPLRVMQRVSTDRERIVAILHDVVEDTAWTFEQLAAEGFDPEILEALRSVTKQEDEPYEDFVRRSAAHPLGRIIKLADLEDNMDVRRMDTVGGKEAQRLEKYLKAWKTLKGQ